ncbi:hypothetical protein EMCRGX_G011921 [Ephydatia muelleri]
MDRDRGDGSNSRPADFLVPNWTLGKPAAFVLTVVSPLSSNTLIEAGATSGSAAGKAEVRKHNANDPKCRELGWCYGQHPLLWHHLGCLTSESGVQQGDPLGPLLFSLVLNILVMKVARDSACSNLPFHAWYLDDGVMAGPRSSLCRILSLLQEEGPALGIIVNLPKCEAFSRHGLDMFPLRMKKSDKPSLEILGIPIGNQEFCSSFISKKHTKAKILLSLLEEVGIVDPQVALILLRLCGAFCKLVHLARATPSTLTSKVFALIDDDIRMTFCRCIGVDMSDTAWQQAQLSPSRGGLGFWSLSRHSSAAFISSLCSSGFGLQSSHHLSQAIETFNSLVSPADAVSVESLLTSSVSQKYLSGKLDDRVFNMLLNSSSVADKARLLSVSSPHAASWLSVVPSENLVHLITLATMQLPASMVEMWSLAIIGLGTSW